MLGELGGLPKAGCWLSLRTSEFLDRLVYAANKQAGFLLKAAADLQSGLAQPSESFAGLGKIGDHLAAGGIGISATGAGAGNASRNIAGDFFPGCRLQYQISCRVRAP
jgi:hypothetical protein